MNPDTAAMLKAMGLIPWDTTPDAEDGTLTYFIPSISRRPQYSVKVLPTTPPSALFLAIWQAGGEARREEIAKAHQTFLAALA
jgi:hypothetical protein